MMGHDVLDVHIVVIGQIPSEGMKPMANERDTKVSQNFPKTISKGSVNDRMEWW